MAIARPKSKLLPPMNVEYTSAVPAAFNLVTKTSEKLLVAPVRLNAPAVVVKSGDCVVPTNRRCRPHRRDAGGEFVARAAKERRVLNARIDDQLVVGPITLDDEAEAGSPRSARNGSRRARARRRSSDTRPAGRRAARPGPCRSAARPRRPSRGRSTRGKPGRCPRSARRAARGTRTSACRLLAQARSIPGQSSR